MASAFPSGKQEDEQPAPASPVQSPRPLSMQYNGPGQAPPPLLKDSPAEQQQQNQNSNTQPVGTGFVNIGRYLAANQGIGQDINRVGGNLLRSEGKRVDAAVGDAQNRSRNALNSVPGSISAQRVQDILSGGTQDEKDSLSKYVTPMADAAQVGPLDWSGKDAKSLAGLGDSRTAGRVINQANNPNAIGGYTPNIEAIDRALYGGVGGAKTASDQLGRSYGALQERGNNAVYAANQNISDANKAAGEQTKRNADAFRGAAANIVSGAQSQADAANAADAAAAQNKWNPGGGMTSVWRPGANGPAQAQNFLGQGGQDSLSQISKLLGDPSIAMQAGPAYRRGQWVAQLPGAVANQPESFSASQTPGAETYQPGSVGTPEQQAARLANQPVDQYGRPINFGRG